jgi:DNA-binding transcriptional LysR family regulator
MDQDYALFAAVIDSGSLSAAGRRLHLSPAMVSKRLRRLEERLGARLINRTTRRLSVTAAGQAFHQDITAILAAAAAAEARVSGLTAAPAGPLRISAPTSFGRLHIAPRLSRFLERYPRVEIELQLEDGFVDLVGARIDLAIRIAATVDPGLEAVRLAANRRVLCAAPSYLARHGGPVDLADLRGHRLLAATNPTPWRLQAGDRRRVLPVESHVRTNSSEVVRELAIAGVGIALRSTWDVGRELRAGTLVRVCPEWEGATDVAIYAVRPRADLVAVAVRAFVEDLLATFAPVPPWETDSQGDRALD